MAELCVYAVVVTPTGRIHVKGISGEPLQALKVGRLAVIVGRVRSAPKPTVRNLRRYDRSMFELWRRMPALLPVRFGTTARDAADLAVMIRGREQNLRRTLRAVRNRAQMNVRMSEGSGNGDQETGLGCAPSSSTLDTRTSTPDRRSPTRGRRYLHALAEEDRRARAVPGFAPLRAAVTHLVRDERVEKRAGVASVYHLVPRGSAGRYRAAIENAAREAGIRMVVSGPWPPYAFAGTW